MSYSIDLRERVVAFVKAGGTKAEAARRFSVSEGSVHNWLKRNNLAPIKVKRRHRKLDWNALERHIQQEPDVRLKDRAEHFGVHTSAIWYAIKQMNITRKKTAQVSRTQSSRETEVSATITADCSATGKPRSHLH